MSYEEVFMNRKFLIIFFGLFFLLLTVQAIAEVNLTELVKKVQPAVVTIITYDSNQRVSGQGSGFFINNKGHLITNYHVLEEAHSAEVLTYNSRKYPIKSVIGENETTDLIKVLVDIPAESVRWLKVTKATPAVAERIVVIGSPMGLEQTVSEGIIAGVRENPNIGKVFQISASISSGSSGSPVINMKGEVLGVATFYLMKGQNLNFAVPGEYVLNLKRVKTDKTISEWSYNIRQKDIEEAQKIALAGHIALWKNENEKAFEALKIAIEIDPNCRFAWHGLGEYYGNVKKWNDAEEAYKQVLRLEPDDAEAHFRLGLVYFIKGNIIDAIEEYKILKGLDKKKADDLFDVIYP
jgi:hypothetical protein